MMDLETFENFTLPIDPELKDQLQAGEEVLYMVAMGKPEDHEGLSGDPMPTPGMPFLGADASYEDAHCVIVGVPFDRATSFQAGTRSAPNSIREASHNFQTYLFEHDLELCQARIHDMGNLMGITSLHEMLEKVGGIARQVISDGKFPIFIGGEHSISVPVIDSFEDVGIISIDAHLDYHQEFVGQGSGHAFTVRRAVERVGRDNVLVFGVRSLSKDKDNGMPEYIDAYSIAEEGVEKAFKRALNIIKKDRIYLTLDIDGIDPAYAPGTGMPEPFGISALDVKKCINMLGPRMVGFDVVEISPAYDRGNTAALGARMAIEAIAVSRKYRR